MQKYFIYIVFYLYLPGVILSQQTIGLFQHSPGSNDNGYVLFSPISFTGTYLIDKCGKHLHSWTSIYRPGLSSYLLPDGNLLRAGTYPNPSFNAGGKGGILEILNWNSNVAWSYVISTSTQCQHHDAKPLANGNVFTIIWVKKTSTEAIAAGRNPSLLGSELWTEKIVELQPTGINTANIIWEWNVWDNLIQDYDPAKPNYGVVSEHPELINLNYVGPGGVSSPDWLHINSVDYNPLFNQVILSVHDFNEFWIIDRDLGTKGNIVYRWGNPVTYNRGTTSDRKLFGQHNVQWIESGLDYSGDILIFNNGVGRVGNYSSIDIVKPPVDSNGNYTINPGMPFGPNSAHWIYTDSIPSSFYAMNISGVEELNNGNFLICDGPSGEFFEIDSLKRKVWSYINPVNINGPMIQGSTPSQNTVFRCSFYNSSYSGFNGHTLIPGNPIELNPLPYNCTLIPITLYLSSLIEGMYNEITNTMVQDTVSIFLRNTFSPHLIVDSARSYLNSSGNGLFNFYKASYGISYYFILKHRNSIETWSAIGNSFTSDTLFYDFTTSSSQAYGNNLKLKGTRWTVYSGDVNQDGIIDASDISTIDNDSYNSVSGYVITDLNGDQFVDASDLSLVDNNAFNSIMTIRP